MRDLLSFTPDDLLTTPSRLDAVVSPEVQRDFLGGRRSSISSSSFSGAVMSRRLSRLSAAGCHEAVLKFLAHYVALVLPDPVVTEGSFWAVEIVDDIEVPLDVPRRLVRVSVHGVPVATVVEDPDGDGEIPLVYLALAPVPMVGRVYCPEPAYLDVDGTPVPVQQGRGTTEDLTGGLLADPDLLLAARRAVVGLMRLGPAEWSRHHRDVADAVFAVMTATDELTGPSPRV